MPNTALVTVVEMPQFLAATRKPFDEEERAGIISPAIRPMGI